jgi:hypothetical protein
MSAVKEGPSADRETMRVIFFLSLRAKYASASHSRYRELPERDRVLVMWVNGGAESECCAYDVDAAADKRLTETINITAPHMHNAVCERVDEVVPVAGENV